MHYSGSFTTEQQTIHDSLMQKGVSLAMQFVGDIMKINAKKGTGISIMKKYSLKFKIFRSTPFIILFSVVLNTWILFLSTDYVASWRHYLLLALLLTNSVLYFTRFKQALLLTGIILILCTFYLLPPFITLESSFIKIGPVFVPWIEYWSFLILIIYFVINFNLLIEFYLDFKEKKE